MRREKKPYCVGGRTNEAVKLALDAEARRQKRTSSEVVHSILSEFFRIDEETGVPLEQRAIAEDTRGPAARRPSIPEPA